MATAATKPAETTESAPPPIKLRDPKPLEIKPENVERHPGRYNCRVLVRCPKGMVADDLRDPRVWHKVQIHSQSSLRQLDELLILAFDQSWYCRAIVANATNAEAKLQIEKVGAFCAISDGLFSDGEFQVNWNGVNYDVRRLRDGAVMSNGHATEGMAIDALRKLRPQRIT